MLLIAIAEKNVYINSGKIERDMRCISRKILTWTNLLIQTPNLIKIKKKNEQFTAIKINTG